MLCLCVIHLQHMPANAGFICLCWISSTHLLALMCFLCVVVCPMDFFHEFACTICVSLSWLLVRRLTPAVFVCVIHFIHLCFPLSSTINLIGAITVTLTPASNNSTASNLRLISFVGLMVSCTNTTVGPNHLVFAVSSTVTHWWIQLNGIRPANAGSIRLCSLT